MNTAQLQQTDLLATHASRVRGGFSEHKRSTSVQATSAAALVGGIHSPGPTSKSLHSPTAAAGKIVSPEEDWHNRRATGSARCCEFGGAAGRPSRASSCRSRTAAECSCGGKQVNGPPQTDPGARGDSGAASREASVSCARSAATQDPVCLERCSLARDGAATTPWPAATKAADTSGLVRRQQRQVGRAMAAWPPCPPVGSTTRVLPPEGVTSPPDGPPKPLLLPLSHLFQAENSLCSSATGRNEGSSAKGEASATNGTLGASPVLVSAQSACRVKYFGLNSCEAAAASRFATAVVHTRRQRGHGEVEGKRSGIFKTAIARRGQGEAGQRWRDLRSSMRRACRLPPAHRPAHRPAPGLL